MGTFKETQGDPDRIDYGKIAKSLVEQFIHTVTQWGPVPVSFHMPCFEVSFVVCQSFHLSRIAKSQRLEHRAISFFHDWSCSFFERLRYFNVLIRMHWAGITSESLVLQPRRLKPSVFCEKKILKESSLNFQIDWILEIFINWSIHGVYCKSQNMHVHMQSPAFREICASLGSPLLESSWHSWPGSMYNLRRGQIGLAKLGLGACYGEDSDPCMFSPKRLKLNNWINWIDNWWNTKKH